MNDAFLAGHRKDHRFLTSAPTAWLARETARMRASDGLSPFPVAIISTVAVVAAVLVTTVSVGDPTLAGLAVLLATVVFFGTWVGWIDCRSHRIPDAVTIPMVAAVGATIMGCTALSGDWPLAGQAALGGAALGGFYLAAAVFGDLGVGDVKLAAILGVTLAYSSWTALLWGCSMGLILALPHALWIRGQGRRIPLGPYMVAGAVLALIPAIVEVLGR
jgi:leader peptidase (prepilin peptidase)/N-methyltransferase